MKYLKKFNENIKEKDIQDQIDYILDNLSKKKELSKSEKEFLDANSKSEIETVTTPEPSGDFWADMSNPHNSGILWKHKGIWKELLTLEEEEEEEEISKEESSDERFEREKKKRQEKILDELGEPFKNLLLELAEEHIKNENKVNNLSEQLKKLINNSESKWNYNQKLDYATKNIYSLMNQFGYILPEIKIDDNGTHTIKK